MGMDGSKFIPLRANLFVFEVVSWIELCCSFLGVVDVIVAPNKVEIYGFLLVLVIVIVSIITTVNFRANGIPAITPKRDQTRYSLWEMR